MTNLTAPHLDERVVLSDGSTLKAVQATTGTPTQVSNPSRASWRTFVQAIVPTAIVLNLALPIIYGLLTSPEFAPRLGELLGPVYGWITIGLNVAIFFLGLLAKLGALLMANPTVNAWITKHLPWLAPIKPLT